MARWREPSPASLRDEAPSALCRLSTSLSPPESRAPEVPGEVPGDPPAPAGLNPLCEADAGTNPLGWPTGSRCLAGSSSSSGFASDSSSDLSTRNAPGFGQRGSTRDAIEPTLRVDSIEIERPPSAEERLGNHVSRHLDILNDNSEVCRLFCLCWPSRPWAGTRRDPYARCRFEPGQRIARIRFRTCCPRSDRSSSRMQHIHSRSESTALVLSSGIPQKLYRSRAASFAGFSGPSAPELSVRRGDLIAGRRDGAVARP